MLTDIAFRVGQTLTLAVNLPADTPKEPYCTAKEPSLFKRLQTLFSLPYAAVHQMLHVHRQTRLNRELSMLPATVLNDLNIDIHQVREAAQISHLFNHAADADSDKNWYYR